MKKLIYSLFALSLLLGPAAMAQEGRHHGGDGGGGGWGNGGSNSGGNGESQGGSKARVKKSRPTQNHSQYNNGGFHRFNRNGNGTSNSLKPSGSFQNRGRSTGPGYQSRNSSLNPKTDNFNHSFQASPHLRQLGIKNVPQPIQDKRKLLTADPQHSSFVQPKVGPSGESLHASLIKPVGENRTLIQNHMTSIVHNTNFSAQVNVYNNRETIANHYYWHTYNGTSYAHYYDNWGYHWYGWYWGGSCFWTRWYANNWWWYDPAAFRWCYWYDGGWWWQDPYHVNVVYAYNGDQYVPATEQGGASQGPEVLFHSNDWTRMVKVVGGDAFLYDTAEGETDNKPIYLGANVKEVKFSKPSFGRAQQILVIYNDGSFEMFDWDGNSPQDSRGENQQTEPPPSGEGVSPNPPAQDPPPQNPSPAPGDVH